MLACVDVDYRVDGACAACLLFRHWDDAVARHECVARVSPVAPYESGRFYLRELPCLLAVLARTNEQPSVVIVDAHVWLDDARPGLGAHLHTALAGRTAVVGVAKHAYAGAPSIAVARGRSQRPLYVTAAGMDAGEAAERIREMHGPHRVPTLLRRVDRLARGS